MKWKFDPPFLPLKSVSNPYPQSIPKRPIMGKKTRTPTPAARLMEKGLKSRISLQQFPPLQEKKGIYG